jgi:GNAT superfamily N-acetyltransferase
MESLDVGRIRPYHSEDREAVLALASRLVVGIAPWRSPEGMVVAARRWVEESIAGIGPVCAVFVAECEEGTIVGFATVARRIEFTGEPQAYIGELAVAEESEGAGIGQRLLAAVEGWARDQGLALIVLETGAGNARARRFYARSGFVEEGVKLTRVLAPDARHG